MVATFVIHVITWITSHLPIQKEWKAELAKFACVARQNPVAGKITDSGSRVVTNGEIF